MRVHNVYNWNGGLLHVVAFCTVKPVQLYVALLGVSSAKVRAERRAGQRAGKVR